MSLVGLLLALVVLCVVIWAARAIMAAFHLGEPISTLIYVAIVVVVVFWLVGQLGGAHLGSLRIT